MKIEMMIRSIESDEIAEAETFIRKVFDESVAEEYSEDGIRHFYQIVREGSIKERFLNGSVIFVAKTNNKISGYIEIINLNHIFLLFVRREFQKKGIARKLIETSLKFLMDINPDLQKLTVNSTSSAITVYEKLGFKKIADYQFKNGILSFPMRFDIR